MKAILFVFGSAMLIGACSDQTPGDTAAGPAGAATVASAPACPEPFYSPIPDAAVNFDFRFHVSSDRYYVTAGGGSRRRLVIEYFDGDADQAWRDVEIAMRRAGYRFADEGVAANKGTFKKANSPSIYFDATGKQPKNPANPEAKGSI